MPVRGQARSAARTDQWLCLPLPLPPDLPWTAARCRPDLPWVAVSARPWPSPSSLPSCRGSWSGPAAARPRSSGPVAVGATLPQSDWAAALTRAPWSGSPGGGVRHEGHVGAVVGRGRAGRRVEQRGDLAGGRGGRPRAAAVGGLGLGVPRSRAVGLGRVGVVARSAARSVGGRRVGVVGSRTRPRPARRRRRSRRPRVGGSAGRGRRDHRARTRRWAWSRPRWRPWPSRRPALIMAAATAIEATRRLRARALARRVSTAASGAVRRDECDERCDDG